MLLAKNLSRPAPNLDQLALQDFAHAVHRALWRDWLSWLIRKNNNLLPFEQVRRHLSFKGQHQRGLCAVPLDKLWGA